MRPALLALACACTPALPPPPAPPPPPLAAPISAARAPTHPLGPPLAPAPRRLDVPAAGVALAWTHPHAGQQLVVLDRQLVLVDQSPAGATHRFTVLDATTGAVASRGTLPPGRALCLGPWFDDIAPGAVVRQCDPPALVAFDLARQAPRWTTPIFNDAAVDEIVASIAGRTILVRSDMTRNELRLRRVDEATGTITDLPTLTALWTAAGGRFTVVGDTLLLAAATGSVLGKFPDAYVSNKVDIGFPAPQTVLALSLTTGAEQWSRTVAGPIHALAADEARVAVHLEDGTFLVLDARTGAPAPLPAKTCVIPVALAGDLLYGNACGRGLRAVAHDVTTGRVRWQQPLAAAALTADVALLRDLEAPIVRPVALATGEPVWGSPWLPADIRTFDAGGERLLIGTAGAHVVAFRLVQDPPAPRRVTVRGAFTVAGAPWPRARLLVGDVPATTDARGEFAATIDLGAFAAVRLAPRERAALIRRHGDWMYSAEAWAPILGDVAGEPAVRIDLRREE